VASIKNNKPTKNKMEFNFDNKYVLEDNRVILKPLELSDFENLICFTINEPEIWKYSLVQAIGEMD